MAAPSVEAQLIPVAGSPIDLSFTLGSGSAVYVDQTIPTGNHTLVLKLRDNGNTVVGAVEVVKILNFAVPPPVCSNSLDVDQEGACIAVNITPDVSDAISVVVGGQLEEISLGDSMALHASTPGVTDNVVYVWYLNGEAIETGAAYTVGSDLSLGTYRLDVTAFSADGSEAGNATHTFSVIDPDEEPPPPPPAEVTLAWDPNSEIDLSGYRIHYGTSSGRLYRRQRRRQTVDLHRYGPHTGSDVLL